jgi:acetyl esterase/lipase
MRSLQHFLKPLRPHIAKRRKTQPAGSQKLSPPDKVTKQCRVTEKQVDGIWLYELVSLEQVKTTDEGPVRRVYYFAGGGWQMPPSRNHWSLVAELSHRLPDTIFTVVSYPLAPKSPASESLPQLRKLYNTIMTDPATANDRIVFSGDSAGGNLSIALVMWALTEMAEGKASDRAPDAIVGICPSTDLRHLDPKIEATAHDDPMFTVEFIQSTAKAWADGQVDTPSLTPTGPEGYKAWSMSDPRVTPALANVSLLTRYKVKVHGITGTRDVLAPEAMAFRDRCAEMGVEGQWLEWEGQMHCFPLTFAYGLKEAKDAVTWLVGIFKSI